MDDYIYVYTRADALEDGVLVDVSELAKKAGFKVPVAITDTLHGRLEPSEEDKADGQDFDGRLWDVLYLASLGARKEIRDLLSFEVLIYESRTYHLMKLWARIDGGDDGNPVITIGYPSDF